MTSQWATSSTAMIVQCARKIENAATVTDPFCTGVLLLAPASAREPQRRSLSNSSLFRSPEHTSGSATA